MERAIVMKIMFVRKARLEAEGAAAAIYFPKVLAELGHDVMLVGLGDPQQTALADSNVTVRCADYNWTRHLIECAREAQPDIIHTFIYSGCGALPILLRRHCDARYVLDIRSPLIRTGLAATAHRLKNIFEPMSFDVVTAHGLASAATVVGRRRAVKWVPPGVDLSLVPAGAETTVRAGGTQNRRLKLVYIGALNKVRNISLLLSGLAQIRSGISVSLDIFGLGEGESDLRAEIDSLGLSSIVRMNGKLPRDELFKRLVQFDAGLAFVPNTLFETAPPLKTIEYMACGLPVLASDTIGNRIFIEDGTTGLLFSNDPHSIACAIERFAKLQDREAMSKRALDIAQTFSWKEIVPQRLLPVYDELLK